MKQKAKPASKDITTVMERLNNEIMILLLYYANTDCLSRKHEINKLHISYIYLATMCTIVGFHTGSAARFEGNSQQDDK